MGRDPAGTAGILLRPYFNPRAPHGARRAWTAKAYGHKLDFNPRAPHGARQSDRHQAGRAREFQSTRPAWGATMAQKGP